MGRKTDFDQYIEETIKKHPSVKKELERAERAWDIAFQIKELRERRGLTQAELAGLAGISQPNVARIENADYQSYTLKTLEKVARALKAQVDVIVIPEERIEEHRRSLPRPVFAFPVAVSAKG